MGPKACDLTGENHSFLIYSNWMAFDIQLVKGEAERIDIYPAGKLKSGVDLLVLNKRTGKTKDKNVMRVLEFYLCKDHQTIEYSTCMHFHDDSE